MIPVTCQGRYIPYAQGDVAIWGVTQGVGGTDLSLPVSPWWHALARVHRHCNPTSAPGRRGARQAHFVGEVRDGGQHTPKRCRSALGLRSSPADLPSAPGRNAPARTDRTHPQPLSRASGGAFVLVVTQPPLRHRR